MDATVEWFVGVDWGMDAHHVCVIDGAGHTRGEREVRHTAKDLVGFADWLVSETGARPQCIAIALETPRGAVVDTMIERGFIVHAINPKQVDRFRDRYTLAGAKDDRRDARTLAAALRTDREAFRRLHVEDGRLVQLRELSRIDEDLQHDRNGLSNRLREQIYRIRPALLEVCPAADDLWFWAMAEDVLVTQRRPSAARLRSMLRAHRIRRVTPTQLLEVLARDDLYTAPGVMEATRFHIGSLIARLRVVHAERRRCEAAMKTVLGELRARRTTDRATYEDIDILESLPGVGIRVVATLLSEAARSLAEHDYGLLRSCMGLAPVTERSGKRRAPLVHMRRACNHRLRQAAYHWGRISIQQDPVSRRYYDRLRARGKTHGGALRVIVDRWLRILMAMLRDRTLYDATRHATVDPAVSPA